MARAYDLPEDPGMNHEFDFRTYDRRRSQVGPFRVEAVPVCTRWRPTGSASRPGAAPLAYTGDTGPCDALDRLAAGADLLLAEASFRDGDDNPPRDPPDRHRRRRARGRARGSAAW